MNKTNKTIMWCIHTLAIVLVTMAFSSCNGNDGDSSNKSGNETFSAQIDQLTIRRLDNNESIPVEGTAASGAIVTLNR